MIRVTLSEFANLGVNRTDITFGRMDVMAAGSKGFSQTNFLHYTHSWQSHA